MEVEIVNDNQWEPDEEFYLRMSLLNEKEDREGVQLGRISIMEIVILNDDGQYTYSNNIYLFNLHFIHHTMFTTEICLSLFWSKPMFWNILTMQINAIASDVHLFYQSLV